ncbi:Cytochrome b561 and DOMON domain-containing protein [Psidium guajava]|nr:Cytochrome b561 and DOMON domain-containing protein [Psidium guajava]
MDRFFKQQRLLVCATMVMSMVVLSSAQTCSNYAFSGNKGFSSCVDLPYLSSFLHWTYDSSANTAQIAYRHASVGASTWVAWAINPTSTGMVGAQSLVAYQQSDGTMRAYTSPISGYQTQLAEGDLSFNVSDISATYASNEIIIFATISPPSNGVVNQVWQDGPLSSGSPGVHATTGANVQSMGTLNFASGQAAASGGGNSKTRKRNTHGVLNAVSWGILMPVGAIIARYLKVSKAADPLWFYLHVACQSSAYVVGVAGWATGIKLGSESPGITYTAHRTIGIVLFCLGTLQVFALLLRPKKDHKYRFYWNIYHHSMGYAVIILSIINIFKGFNILDPEKKWKDAYIGVIVALGCVAVVLEAFTWYVVLKRKSQSGSKTPHGMNGSNGYNHNGYGARPHQEA